MYSPENINLEPGSGPVVTATFEVINTAYADSVSLYIENVMVTDGIGGTYWIASADSGTVVVYPGYIEEPSNLQALDGQDAYVNLTWDPPSGPIPDNIVEDFEAGFQKIGRSQQTQLRDGILQQTARVNGGQFLLIQIICAQMMTKQMMMVQ